MKTTKSPRKLMEVSYACAKRALPAFANLYSPKKFTQHQLFACLALKEFLKLDYRGIMHLLMDSPDLCAVIELNHVPHWTTLQKAADRLLKKTPRIRFLIRRLNSPARRDCSAAAVRG